jgi:hypothetical protein
MGGRRNSHGSLPTAERQHSTRTTNQMAAFGPTAEGIGRGPDGSKAVSAQPIDDYTCCNAVDVLLWLWLYCLRVENISRMMHTIFPHILTQGINRFLLEPGKLSGG